MTTERPNFWHRAATSAGLCMFFLIVYGACNAYTATRTDVGIWVYAWEHYIPFVPLAIIPYLSIDVFFVAAPFLCRNQRELSILSRRIVLAIAVAGFFFLAMPLRFSFDRPPALGVLGVVYDWFRAMDKPFNQFPSLHIALRTILAGFYASHTRGWKRVSSEIWFSLIGASTLLTYQHHVIDIVGGFLLGVVCFYLVSDAPWRQPLVRNVRIGAYYAGGAAALAGAAIAFWPWAALLLWPALSLAIVAGAYVGLGPGIFRKHGGRLPLASRLLLAPVIAGQHLSRLHYARRSRAWDVVNKNLLIGRTLNAHEAQEALAGGVTAILDLTSELPEALPFALHANYRNQPILDLTAPTTHQLNESIAFIDEHARNGGIVYVHCKAGYSRSAAVVAAYLLHTGQAGTVEEALNAVRACRRGIIVRGEIAKALHRQKRHSMHDGMMTRLPKAGGACTTRDE